MPTWVGDLVMATPALHALRRRLPGSHLAVLIKPNAGEVLQGLAWIDEVMVSKGSSRGLARLLGVLATARELRRRRFSSVVLFSNSFHSALLARLGGIPRRVGYDRDGRGWLLTDGMKAPRRGGRHAVVSAVAYYNALVRRLGCDDPGEALELATDAADDAVVEERLAKWGIERARPLVVINPGASFGVSKLWIPERYAEVADRLVAEREAAVVIAFGPGERELAVRIRDAMRHRSYLVDDPPGTLGQLKSLIARCDLLLNNDTGPRHFAKAFGRKVVTVFGSTHPGWTHTDYPRERIVRIDVDCGPCQKKVCPLGHHQCMTGVSSTMVRDAAVALLDGAG